MKLPNSPTKHKEDKEERPPKAIAECFADRRTSWWHQTLRHMKAGKHVTFLHVRNTICTLYIPIQYTSCNDHITFITSSLYVFGPWWCKMLWRHQEWLGILALNEGMAQPLLRCRDALCSLDWEIAAVGSTHPKNRRGTWGEQWLDMDG